MKLSANFVSKFELNECFASATEDLLMATFLIKIQVFLFKNDYIKGFYQFIGSIVS